MRAFWAVMMLCAVHLSSAQIQIIPREKILEAAELKSVESALRLVNDKVDFGTIAEMSGVWQGSAMLVNGGIDTIVITRLKTTCGCLKVEVQKKILAPKEQTALSLKYYPRGHAGRVMQRVFVYTNVSDTNPSAIVQLNGIVTASADRSDDYPYVRGVLRLRQESVRFVGAGRQVARIAVMNGGSTELRPSVDTNFLPKGVKVRFEPATLASKQEGDMVVEYIPQGTENGRRNFKIYITGLNLPPRQSSIEVTAER